MNSDSKIFFSYAWRDLGLAMRIDADLRRSGLKGLWRDRVDGQLCGDFREEYRERILACDVFLLLDSPSYRLHSHYCRDEIAFFEECRRSHPEKRLVVCLAQADGAWRREALFQNQAEQLYVEFGTAGPYDDTGTYNVAMERLCTSFGIRFVPWTKAVFEQDFLDELQHGPELEEPLVARLREDYRSLDFYLLRNLPSTETRIRSLVADCEYFGLQTIFPSVFLCEYLLGQHRIEACREELRKMQERFSDDPRPLRWAGTADFLLGNADAALSEFFRAEQLAAASTLPGQRKFLKHIRLNILHTLVHLNRLREARQRAEEFCRVFAQTDWDDWMYYSYVAQAFLLSGEHDARIGELLTQGIVRFPSEPSLHALAGFYDSMQGRIRQAVARYREAIRCAGSVDEMLQYASHLAVVYKKSGMQRELADLKHVCVTLCSSRADLSEAARENLQTILSLC